MIPRRQMLVAAATSVALASSPVARAQLGARLPRVVLFTFTPAFKDSFVAGLREFGWVAGENVIVDWHRDPTPREREREIEAEVSRKPDVLVLANPLTIATGIRKTTTLPIVGIDLESDPVAVGFVISLARPGGNVTGIWLDLPEMAGKLVQLLREAMPHLSMAGVLWDEGVGRSQLQAAQEAGRVVGLNFALVSVSREDDIDRALERLVRDGVRAVIMLSAPALNRGRARLARLAMKHRLPSIGPLPLFAEAGGLIGYGPSLPDMYRLAARPVDRVLRGTRPADLPIERPAKFELVVNARTAKALGFEIPRSLLVQANRVIE